MRLVKRFILIPIMCIAMTFTFSFDSPETPKAYWHNGYVSIYDLNRKLDELEKELAELVEQGLMHDVIREEGEMYRVTIHDEAQVYL